MSEPLDRPEFIHVETRFQTYAKAPGGVSAAIAIPRANKEVAAMEGRFLWDLGADLAMLEGLLASMTEAGQPAGTTIERAYRHCRRIRDRAGTFGYEIVTEVAERLCELLYRIQVAEELSVEAVELCFAGLNKVCSPDGGALTEEQRAALLAHLDGVVDRLPRVFDPEAIKTM